MVDQLAPDQQTMTHINEDALYRAELEEWTATGAVDLRWAFHRPSSSASVGKQYVQDRYWADRDKVADLFVIGGQIYICGSGQVAEGIRDKTVQIMMAKRWRKAEKKSARRRQMNGFAA